MGGAKMPAPQGESLPRTRQSQDRLSAFVTLDRISHTFSAILQKINIEANTETKPP